MNSGLCEHCLRVAYLVTDMTILLGMDEKATMDVQLAAIYHDIGKTQIPEQVLNKPGKLTPGEYFIMKLHAEIGYRMIQCHTSPETAQMVLYHHEDYDGGGYFGLQGNDIPYGARILRICDVYDALTSFRCYREPCSPEKALQYLNPNNKIVIKKADFEKLLNKTYAAGYQDGLKEPRPAQVWMTSKRGFDTEPKVLSI